MLAAGLIIGIATANLALIDLALDQGEELAHVADQIKLKLRERLESHELILRGSSGHFASSPGVSRTEWKAYIDTLRP